ncbi:MAG TPA: hypothetical protein VFM18_00015 [Methanosarcina sp.]|nr:hypothetical protein [Methanosarcina sp.]
MADRTGFLAFIRSSMGITTAQLPDASTDIDNALNLSLAFVNDIIQQASTTLYDTAVYNLGGHYLIEFASDQPGLTYFADARTSFDINGFVAGVIQSAGDQGTSEAMLVPDFFKEFQMSDLDVMRTPWGRFYLAIAQKMAYTWGLS